MKTVVEIKTKLINEDVQDLLDFNEFVFSTINNRTFSLIVPKTRQNVTIAKPFFDKTKPLNFMFIYSDIPITITITNTETEVDTVLENLTMCLLAGESISNNGTIKINNDNEENDAKIKVIMSANVEEPNILE